ncbi:hypothetical protein ACFQYP_35925 [Nonomuraea antimicrobica]
MVVRAARGGAADAEAQDAEPGSLVAVEPQVEDLPLLVLRQGLEQLVAPERLRDAETVDLLVPDAFVHGDGRWAGGMCRGQRGEAEQADRDESS